MDDELLELQRQFEFAQQAKSNIRLSDRNVVELVQKLQQLQVIDFELLHTASGKEYITLDQLRNEMVTEVKRLGRISVIDLADVTGVDLYYVEKLAQSIITDHGELMLTQGEIVTESYWDSIAEENNERLQECSQIALTELAAQLNVGLDLIASVLEPRLGTIVKGRLEGGQLYTPAYVARVSAMVRGAARGITVPTNLTVLWSSLQNLLQEMDGASGVAVDGSFGLVKGGEISGSVRAGVHWTPAVFAVAQKESVDSFFSQNSFISYDVLQKLGIPQPVQFFPIYPEGKPLVTTFVHPSMIEMLDAATEDALERGSWSDSLSLLSSSFTPQDASKMLFLCQSVQLALKSNKAHIFGDFYVLSSSFMKDICDCTVKELETLAVSRSLGTVKPGDLPIANEVKAGYDSSRLSVSSEMASDSGSNKHADKGPKKKKGKATGNALANQSESGADNQEHTSTKSKKSQRKGKDTSSQTSDSKQGSRKESLKMKEDNLSSPSEEWIMEKITALVPDFEEQGIDDPETILRPLDNKLRPTIINTWMEKRKALFKDNAERMKQLLDNLQKKLDESFLNMQLYEKALELFEDDQSTSVVLHRHLLRTVAAPMVDMLLHDLDEQNKLKNGVEVQESPNSESISFSPGDRAAISKSFPGALSNKALAVVEALEGKRVETFMSSFRAVTEESGLPLKKLDKKLERTLLHSYRKELTSQVSAETDPVSLLPKVVSLLYVQVYHKALQAPGRAISVAISQLTDKLDETACKIIADYQAAAVTLLTLSATPDDEDSCASNKIREILESQMPALKSLVSGASRS
ncbi:unnamed protein product [Vicia faba]|uniref:E3 UFM1-protein ligase 1 homolog n=1 Tax=Vicia faba TaxID=3906 RepID=A0AAV1AGT3_VICFA|nr:unnamed protein product [Vicia faba]